MTHESPDPAYTFIFVVEDGYTVSSNRGLIISGSPKSTWSMSSQTAKTLLRTPEGKVFESVASFVHTTPSLNDTVLLNLADVTKTDIPVGTEVFVRVRRTPQELQDALSELDELMGTNWKGVDEFHDFPDALDFLLWMEQQESKGLAVEVPIKKPHRQNKSGEHWYRNLATDQVWRYLETILPSK